MSTVLILTVGTTAEPLLKAVDEQRAEDRQLSVFIIYGRPFPNQRPNPFDVAVEVRQHAVGFGVPAETREVPDPEDVDVCLHVARSVLREAVTADRIVVDFTGGSKPLSGALLHAALTEPLSGQLVLEYTGGPTRDDAGRVLRESMRVRRSERTATDELLRQVLDLLHRSAYREARLLAERLPESGKAAFVRHAVEALYAWDEFDYEASVRIHRRMYESARTLQDVSDVGPVAGLLSRLLEPGNRLEALVRDLRALQRGEDRRPPALDEATLLVADALENASRRIDEGRPTDCVLRAYRAVETAVQARLLARGINPWKPDWDKLERSVLDRYLEALDRKGPPRELALTAGLRLLEVLEKPLPASLQDHLQDLQLNRNRSYLEHGYQRIGPDVARRLLGYAQEVCGFLLQRDLAAARELVTHRLGRD